MASTISLMVSKEGPSSPRGEVATLKNKVKKLEEELRLVHINQFNIMKHLETALELAKTWIDSSKWGLGPSPRAKPRATKKQPVFLANVLMKASEVEVVRRPIKKITRTKSCGDRDDQSDQNNHLAIPNLKSMNLRHRRIPSRRNTVNNIARRRRSIPEGMPMRRSSKLAGFRMEKVRWGVADEKDDYKSEVQLSSLRKQRNSPSRRGELTPDCNSEGYDIQPEFIAGIAGACPSMSSYIWPGPGQENHDVQGLQFTWKEREKNKLLRSKSYPLTKIESTGSGVLVSVEPSSHVKPKQPKLSGLRDWSIYGDEGEFQSWSSRIKEEDLRMSSLDDKDEHSFVRDIQFQSPPKLPSRTVISRSSFK